MSSKVKDGLFLGDIDAAQDAEFLQLNGIVHIINCVPRQVPNLFQQSLGLSYVTCDLDEILRRSFFDLRNREFMGIVQLIDRALEHTQSVLVHSLNGINRSPSIMIGYLMVKYCWGVDKAYEFLLTKRADIKPHESYIDQLCALETQLQSHYGARATEQQMFEWHPKLADQKNDELVLIHTFLNSTSPPTGAPKKLDENKNIVRRLTWVDHSTQLKKLYPSLLIKPERPPNHSYNDMLPANGWIDLITIAHGGNTTTITTTGPRPILRGSTTSSLPSSSLAAASVYDIPGPDPRNALEATDSNEVNGRNRVHSFSVPRRRDPDLELQASSRSLSSVYTDRSDDNDMSIEIGQLTNKSASRKQCNGVTSGRSQKLVSGPGSSRGGSVGQVTSAMAALGYTTSKPSSLNSSSLSSSNAKTPTIKVVEFNRPIKPAARTPSKSNPTSKSSADRKGSLMSNTNRVLFSADFPISQASAGFAVRRAFADPAAASHSASSTGRPRTAPPRLRRKDSDGIDILPASKLSGGVNRVTLEVSNTNEQVKRRQSATVLPSDVITSGANSASFRTQKLSSTTRTPVGRPKPVRAQWK